MVINNHCTKQCHSFPSLHPHSFHELIFIIGDCSNGDMRLIDGVTEAEGSVEICTSGRWATLCGKYWTENNTVVVCRHLGYSDIIDGRLKSLSTFEDIL